jgi:hypothetical protein
MNQAILILTAALGLIVSAWAGGGNTYNPYRGPYGGYDFDNGGGAQTGYQNARAIE